MTIGLAHYLILAAMLFSCGIAAVLVRRNALGILMGVELMLNAANVNLVAFNHYQPGRAVLDGQVFAGFVIVLAAAEAAIALAIFLNFYSRFGSIDVEQARTLNFLPDGGERST